MLTGPPPKFHGTRDILNPTSSYRTRQPLRVVSEVLDWEGHPPHVLQAMLDHLEKLKLLGIEAIND